MRDNRRGRWAGGVSNTFQKIKRLLVVGWFRHNVQTVCCFRHNEVNHKNILSRITLTTSSNGVLKIQTPAPKQIGVLSGKTQKEKHILVQNKYKYMLDKRSH